MCNLKVMNKACLAKLGWTFKTRTSSLWASLMTSKYLSRRFVSGNLISKPCDSYLWKSMVELRPKLYSCPSGKLAMVRPSIFGKMREWPRELS